MQLELDQEEAILVLGVLEGHMDYIVRDIAKLTKENSTEKLRAFYVEMLMDAKEIYDRLLKELKSDKEVT